MSLFYKPTASAATTIDDFEDNDLAEYTSSGGGSYSFATTSNRVFEGTYAVSADASGDNGNKNIGSTSGLPAYPAQGDTFRYRLYLENAAGMNSGMYFAMSEADATSSTLDAYRALYAGRSSELKIQKWANGSASNLASTSLSTVTSGEWLELQIDWAGDGTITFTTFDSSGNQLGQVSATDTDYTGGGIGFASVPDGSSNNQLWADIAEITAT